MQRERWPYQPVPPGVDAHTYREDIRQARRRAYDGEPYALILPATGDDGSRDRALYADRAAWEAIARYHRRRRKARLVLVATGTDGDGGGAA